MISLRKVSGVPVIEQLPADLLHCFNFFTIPIHVLHNKTEGKYLKL